ncbi:MAG: TlpA family protein disulfide reductase [Armatimonadetes bacterium]|nr:TlpA family protein disulfide reductase [Armatimonadota bacterium]
MKQRLAFALALTTLAALSLGQADGTRQVKVNQPLPKFSLTTASGKKFTNANLKGKVAIIDFWATWCLPCKKSIPMLQYLHNKYSSQGLVVVGAEVQDEGASKESLDRFIKKQGMTYTVTVKSDKLADHLGVYGLPTLLVVDRKGKIVNVIEGVEFGEQDRLDTMVKQLLKK